MTSAKIASQTPADVLHHVFGFSAFRGVQEDVVARVLSGERTLAVMPTGAGKSLCFQLPAVMLDGTVVVISPLIALMHDQLRAAASVGIRAATLTSADEDRAETVQRFLGGELDILYVAPERASRREFRDLLAQGRVAMFAIDEAHCVSEWGHDFRPDYRLLGPLMDSFGDIPRLALTATADAHTRADIAAQLGIAADGIIVSGFDRPNIAYHVKQGANAKRELPALVKSLPGAGIIYAPSRAKTEKIAAQISATGRNAAFYHAGLPAEERRRVQAEFVASEDMVMVATIAFGMGIDKPDVRFVIHAGLPKSIEAYYQESGRAGRDGDPAAAHLIWSPNDFLKAREWLSEVPANRRDADEARLTALSQLVEATGCRRAVLLRYFGENPPEDCGNCDNCIEKPNVLDVTKLAQKLLSAAYRTGQRFGITHLERVLTGSRDERIFKFGHDQLSVYDIAEGEEARLIKPVARALQAQGALVATEHSGLKLAGQARAILRGERALEIAVPPDGGRRRRSGGQNPIGDPLFEALRAKRRELASELGIPPYVIFHDSTLRDMAGTRPQSLSAMAEIGGVGAAKLEAYGEAFLAVIGEMA